MLTKKQKELLEKIKQGMLLERTCSSGDIFKGEYRIDGRLTDPEAVEALEAKGLIRAALPTSLTLYGYSTYKLSRCSN